MMRASAFTLIELLIVVAIIAILAAIAIPNFLEAQVRAKASRAKSDLRNLITGLESYAVDHNKYPVPRYAVLPAPTAPKTPCAQFAPGGYHHADAAKTQLVGGLTSPIAYLSGVPKDPFAVGAYDTERDDYGYQNYVIWTTPPGVAAAEKGQALLFTGATALSIRDSYGDYIVRSIGPDQDYTPVNNPYDPTNGTVSRGDIYRTAKRRKGDSRSVGSE